MHATIRINESCERRYLSIVLLLYRCKVAPPNMRLINGPPSLEACWRCARSPADVVPGGNCSSGKRDSLAVACYAIKGLLVSDTDHRSRLSSATFHFWRKSYDLIDKYAVALQPGRAE